MLSIDRHKLVTDIRTLILDTIRLKTLLGARWERPLAEEQRRLHRIRRLLTERLVLLAASRGRIHVVRLPRDQRGARQAWDPAAHASSVVARVLPEYAAATSITGEHAS